MQDHTEVRTLLVIITLGNLRGGIQWWRKNNWPADMHNTDYGDFYTERSIVATGTWWDTTVDRLWEWGAIRSPNPPNSKPAIKARGQILLSAIARRHTQIIASSATEPSITDLSWEDVAPLFALVFAIKRGNNNSPVFASKMCHFLFPKLFVVMDTTATDTFEYEFYWRGMKDEWSRFNEKARAYAMLTQAIGSGNPHALYPYETKIMELSSIGYKHRWDS
jgi:hypothetical protein